MQLPMKKNDITLLAGKIGKLGHHIISWQESDSHHSVI
jgi:hypothetical protein